MKLEVFNGTWTRESVKNDKDKVYLFGDNIVDLKNGYIPSSTQAVIRGLPNAIGIPTKKDRGLYDSSYFWDTDKDYALFCSYVDGAISRAINSGKAIVIPVGGIGTGKAAVKGAFAVKGNRFKAYLDKKLDELKTGEIKLKEAPVVKPGTIRITNLRNHESVYPDVLIRVDRSSILGNPFPMNGEATRDKVCDQYEEYFDRQIECNKAFVDALDYIYNTVMSGKNVVLGCWCAPKRCHAETIKTYIEIRIRKANFINDMFYCLVVGSRDFNDYPMMVRELNHLLVNYKNVTIVSGGARGADLLAERYAKGSGYDVKVFPADWNGYGKRAGFIRNEVMHQYIAKFPHRGCVAFWDGSSKGTAHNFELAKKYNNPIRKIIYTEKMNDVVAFGEVAKLAPSIMVFRGEYEFLSNMYPCDININGTVYPCAETAFQAIKCALPEEAKKIAKLPGLEAKNLGRRIKMRADWNSYRLVAMNDIVTAKFMQHPDLMKKLKAISGDIVENNTWGDKFWGVCNGVGENHLGKILMDLRDFLIQRDDLMDENEEEEMSVPVYSNEDTMAIERLMSDLEQSGIHIMSVFDPKVWGMRDLGYVKIPYTERCIQTDHDDYFYYIYTMERTDTGIKRRGKMKQITREEAIDIVLGLRH